MVEVCPYLKERLVENIGAVMVCSLDNMPLYRKCCPPKNVEQFYICLDEYLSCQKFQTSQHEDREFTKGVS